MGSEFEPKNIFTFVSCTGRLWSCYREQLKVPVACLKSGLCSNCLHACGFVTYKRLPRPGSGSSQGLLNGGLGQHCGWTEFSREIHTHFLQKLNSKFYYFQPTRTFLMPDILPRRNFKVIQQATLLKECKVGSAFFSDLCLLLLEMEAFWLGKFENK